MTAPLSPLSYGPGQWVMGLAQKAERISRAHILSLGKHYLCNSFVTVAYPSTRLLPPDSPPGTHPNRPSR